MHGSFLILLLAACHESLKAGSYPACEELLQEQELYQSNFREIPVVEGFEKRLFFNISLDTEEKNWDIKKTGSLK